MTTAATPQPPPQPTLRTSDDLVVLCATDAYEARCRYCYAPGESQQERLSI